MMWYNNNGKDKDIAVSTRVRLARNFVDYPFEPRLNEAGAREIIKRVSAIFEGKDGWVTVDFTALSPVEKMKYAEEHLVSPEFAEKKTPSALIYNEAEGLYIMVLEEDHLRIQCILPGLDVEEAYRRACAVDEIIDGVMNYAYSEKLGYLTHCPTNLGTGMRASVMLFLPAWTKAGGIRSLQNQLGKIGLTIRGMSGENSQANGCLYQISNQVTLGISEEETIKKLSDIIGQVGAEERGMRKKLTPDQRDSLANTAMRGIGMMVYSLKIASGELMSLYRDVRLGAALGLTGDVTPAMLDELLFSTMPNTLMFGDESIKTPADRDTKRAEIAKSILKGA